MGIGTEIICDWWNYGEGGLLLTLTIYLKDVRVMEKLYLGLQMRSRNRGKLILIILDIRDFDSNNSKLDKFYADDS